MEGADVAQLRTLAEQLARSADQLDTVMKSLHSLVNSTAQWCGADAQRFRSQWNGGSARMLSPISIPAEEIMKSFQGAARIVVA